MFILHVFSIFTLNYAILANLSKNFFNYRHHTNIQILYNILHENGFTQEEIVALQQDDLAKDPRNIQKLSKDFKDHLFLTNNVLLEYHQIPTTFLNLKTLLNILQLNHPKLITADENSNILIYLCGHGNEDFLKIVDRYFLMSNDIHSCINRIHKRVKNILLILDTCQAEGLINREELPKNVSVITTSVLDQSSYSSNTSNKLGIHTVDDFPLLMYENRQKIGTLKVDEFFNKQNFNLETSTVTVTKNEIFKMADFFTQEKRNNQINKFVI